jgi:hypothetical protein
MITKRAYRVKDVDMLVAASIILESAITYKEALQKKRATWADPFFGEQKQKIDTVLQTYLGIDSAKELRRSTGKIIGLKKEALRLLAEFKVQVEEDFNSDKPRREEIIKQLGFSLYIKKAQKKDQEALISLLYQFKTNIAGVEAEVISKGTSQKLIGAIIEHADMLKDADVSQEYSKGTRRVSTAEAITEFNKVYKSIISISKIATKFYKEEAAIKAQFVFSKVAKAINAQKVTPSKPAEAAE